MKNTKFPTVEEAIYLQRLLIDRFGGTHGSRDLGLLESSLVRPKSRYYETLSHQAAALLQSLLTNHCFNDGNKRIAFALCAAFLKMNGYQFQVSVEQAENVLLQDIIEQKEGINHIACWISEHIRSIS